MIAADKKRFISPVFRFNGATGEVLSLESIALTSDPALLGLTDLSQVAVASAQRKADTPVPGVEMDARTRELFEHAFGHSPEALAALHAEKDDPPPEGVTAEDWAKLRHVFGEALNDR